MVSLWPFKGDSTSAASFEKTLSQLSAKINKANADNGQLRLNKRRRRALLTLYSGFAYITICLILFLVTGRQNLGAVEYSAIAGGPVIIYGARRVLDAYYDYRISNSKLYLDGLNQQMEATITKLKAATKYDSTQQLLEKYGGASRAPQPQTPQQPKKKKTDDAQRKQQLPQAARTGIMPPPTANIQGRPGQIPRPSSSGPGQLSRRISTESLSVDSLARMHANIQPGEEFAPNAFEMPNRLPSAQQAPSHYAVGGPKWYERIIDVILGEDETQARNRIVLICQNCRLVNGQAPPGARSLEDMGRWKCSSCQAWNGVQSEEKDILTRMADRPLTSGGSVIQTAPDGVETHVHPENAVASSIDAKEDHNGSFEHVDQESEEGAVESLPIGSEDAGNPPSASTTSKTRQRKKA